MRDSIDNHSELDLKCDFPARESFRKSLLEYLRSIGEQEPRERFLSMPQHQDDDHEIQELSDSDLDMLAAAQGHPIAPGYQRITRPRFFGDGRR